MTVRELYDLLEEKKKATDWTDIASIEAYNEYAKELRSQLEYEWEKDC